MVNSTMNNSRIYVKKAVKLPLPHPPPQFSLIFLQNNIKNILTIIKGITAEGKKVNSKNFRSYAEWIHKYQFKKNKLSS